MIGLCFYILSKGIDFALKILVYIAAVIAIIHTLNLAINLKAGNTATPPELIN